MRTVGAVLVPMVLITGDVMRDAARIAATVLAERSVYRAASFFVGSSAHQCGAGQRSQGLLPGQRAGWTPDRQRRALRPQWLHGGISYVANRFISNCDQF